MTILVTGATGFLGPHLIDRLLAEGEPVRALVRRETDASALEARDVDVVRGDIRNPDDVERAVSGSEVVYHLAARTSHGNLPANTIQTINVDGTRNVAASAAAAGVRRLVLASTTRVYGVVRNHAVDEDTVLRPDSAYPESKAAAERIVLDHHSRYGLSVVIARVTSVFGEGSRSWLPLFQAVAGGRFRLLGRGHNYHHPAHVSDIVDGLRRCSSEAAAAGRTFILAGDSAVQLREMIAMIARELQAPPLPRNLPAAPLYAYRAAGEGARRLGVDRLPRFDRVEFFLSDRIFVLSRAREELGYSPQIDVREAIRRSADYYRARGQLPPAPAATEQLS